MILEWGRIKKQKQNPDPWEVWRSGDGINDLCFSELFLLGGKKNPCCLEGCCDYFKFNLTAEPPIITDRLWKTGSGPSSCIFHSTPLDVIMLFRQINWYHRQVKPFNWLPLGSPWVPLTLNYSNCTGSRGWEVPLVEGHVGALLTFLLNNVHPDQGYPNNHKLFFFKESMHGF